jgi:photosystem II stability/assembly factor-like uncharacterized protein
MTATATGMLVQALPFSTPTLGWALVQDESTGAVHLIVSSDGGTSWRDATSAVAPGSARVAGNPFFLGPDDGWVPIDRAAAHDQRAGLVVDRTTDGGRHWERGRIFAGPAQADVFFLDETTGWLETTEGAAAGCEPARIYATHDGGVTWREISASPLCDGTGGTANGLVAGCDKNGVGFASATVGFAALVCNGGTSGLLRTLDGGRTWAPSGPSLPNGPGGAWAWPPVFSGQQYGAAAVWNGTEPFVAVTSDAGGRWSLERLPSGALGQLGRSSSLCPGASCLDVVTASTWVVALGRSVYETSDGGRAWTLARSGLSVVGLSTDFVTAQVGWAWGGTWGRLFRTTDAGRRWEALA